MQKLPKKPSNFESLAKALTKSWSQYGIYSVGTAFGISKTGDAPSWRFFAYSEDPDNVGRLLPTTVELDGERYLVEVKSVPAALDVNKN